MKLQHCLDKLNKSSEYKEFKSKYKDAFMIAGFFILDLEKGINVHQLDFYLPKEKKVAAFNLDKSVQVQILEAMNQKLPAELDLKTKIDLDTLPGVGPVTAQKIVDQRPFATIQDLLSKKTVSSSVFAKIKDKITAN